METRSNHILVGGIVLALLAALLVFIVWLSQVSGDDQNRYDIFFQQSVEGLAKGSAVTYSGVPVGSVETIQLEPQNPDLVRVRIAVRNTTPVLQGTTASIRGVGFTGVSQIQLDPPAPDGEGRRRRPVPLVCPGTGPSRQCPYGVPRIEPRAGGLGALLNSAPELLERVSTLTLRLTELLSDRNQASIAAILDNVQEMSRSLAERSPEIAATLAEARVTMRQAGNAMERFGRLADSSTSLVNSTDRLLNQEGRPLINDLRHTMRSAENSLRNLDAVLSDARPGVQAFTNQTLPEVGILIRDLRQTSQSLRAITERLQQRGVGGLIGGERLPDYEPGRR
jgi:phospholipid/cholesterol/gamma-HCH transport system substrate-binding protein